MLTVDFNYIHLKPGSRVLDAGCGTGRHLCEAFRTRGVDVIGIDMNRADLAKTRDVLVQLKGDDKGSWMTAMADVTILPFKDESFDLIICSEVLEHVPDNILAIKELMRVLKPGKDIVVSVPTFIPERICWAISESYYLEPGGHIRIYKKRELKNLLESAGARCWRIRHKHALHVPYWWLKCIVGHKSETSRLVNIYKRFLEWDIMTHPPWTRRLDKFLNPVMAKSMVFYLKKGC